MNELELLTRRLAREKAARLEAESILESKSLELHESKIAVETVAKELQSQNVKIQAILNSAGEGIITLDACYRIQSFNPAASRIFKITPQEAIGLVFPDQVNGLDVQSLRQFLDSDEIRLEPTEYAVSLGNQNQSNRILELTISKTIGDDSSAMIVCVRDRTKRKQLENQLAMAQKLESIGLLSAGIAHEINSPMQYVSDNTHFLKDAFADVETLLGKYKKLADIVKTGGAVERFVEDIENEYEIADLDFILDEVPKAIEQTILGAQRVTKIVQAMKVFSHPGESSATGFDLNEAIQSTLNVSKNEWKYVASLELNLEKDLPLCHGYPSKLNQALLNLIINAAHAIRSRLDSEKSLQGKINVSTHDREDCILVIIGDNGCGIPEDQLQKVFDPFFTTKPVGKGTGQGLSIAHSIVVDTHGGKIDLQSTFGVGTTFSIQLPKVNPVVAQSQKQTNERERENTNRR